MKILLSWVIGFIPLRDRKSGGAALIHVVDAVLVDPALNDALTAGLRF